MKFVCDCVFWINISISVGTIDWKEMGRIAVYPAEESWFVWKWLAELSWIMRKEKNGRPKANCWRLDGQCYFVFLPGCAIYLLSGFEHGRGRERMKGVIFLQLHVGVEECHDEDDDEGLPMWGWRSLGPRARHVIRVIMWGSGCVWHDECVWLTDWTFVLLKGLCQMKQTVCVNIISM